MNKNKIHWSSYAVHNDKEIKGFFGDYRFLSNFEKCGSPIEYNDFEFEYTENAYMAAKCLSEDEQSKFVGIFPHEARKIGQTIKLRSDWEDVKYDFMFLFNFQKFDKNLDLRDKLLQTGDKYLEETNAWRDTFWGIDIHLGGENNLGKILMKIRAMFKGVQHSENTDSSLNA